MRPEIQKIIDDMGLSDLFKTSPLENTEPQEKKKPTNYAEVVKQLREETPSEEFKRKYGL